MCVCVGGGGTQKAWHLVRASGASHGAELSVGGRLQDVRPQAWAGACRLRLPSQHRIYSRNSAASPTASPTHTSREGAALTLAPIPAWLCPSVRWGVAGSLPRRGPVSSSVGWGPGGPSLGLGTVSELALPGWGAGSAGSKHPGSVDGLFLPLTGPARSPIGGAPSGLSVPWCLGKFPAPESSRCILSRPPEPRVRVSALPLPVCASGHVTEPL